MRQTIADLERQFFEETEADRLRREALVRHAEKRARRRELDRVHRHGKLRFAGLCLVLFATAALVTVAMFETLYVVMG
ncbi:hypothetical protein [Paraconexibacter sp.]|uniref:hypothetical protein n=1 Tax=Paraconexibacter sp. TaxID=2949640 RepID=UPI0035639D5A